MDDFTKNYNAGLIAEGSPVDANGNPTINNNPSAPALTYGRTGTAAYGGVTMAQDQINKTGSASTNNASGVNTTTYGRTPNATPPAGGFTPTGSGANVPANGSVPGLNNTESGQYNNSLNTLGTPNTVANELKNEGDLIAGRRAQSQDSISKIMAAENSQVTVAQKKAEYAAAAGGMMGVPGAGAKIAGEVQPTIDQAQGELAKILFGIDQTAQADAALMFQNNQAQAQNDIAALDKIAASRQKIQSDAQTTFANASKIPGVDFKTFASSPYGQQLIESAGYDPKMAGLLWNANQQVANQIQYNNLATPLTNPDGTLTFIGHDPTKSGPDSIVRTQIDNAPQGYTTTMVGNMPYWQVTKPDGSPDPNGALYPVQTGKANFITLKDSNGTTYLYDTYSGKTINPGGADTSQAGTPGNDTPATPLSPTSTLGNLFGYYTKGDTGYTPGSGYMGAILNSLGAGFSADTPISQLTPDKMSDLADGVMQAEGGAKSAGAVVHNPAAILWATAKAYGLDTQYGATEYKAPNGYSYASFSDDGVGKNALQTYLTALVSGASKTQQTGTLDPRIASSGLGTTSDKWQANSILNGKQPPPNPTTGSISKSKGNVLAILAKTGYDVTKGWLDFSAVQAWTKANNSTQQVRMRQAEGSVEQSLPSLQTKVDKLNADGTMTGFKFVNKASIEAAAQGLYGTQAAQDAQAVIGQLALITDELGQTFMGGNSPTDSAFALAKGVLSKDFTADEFKTQIGLVKENLQYRKNSWASSGALGANGQMIDMSGGSAGGDTSGSNNQNTNDPLGLGL